MSEKITFSELVEKLSAKTSQSQQSTNDFIHELASIIESSLGTGEKISISGFGKFELRWIDERKGRNPQTGEEITIPGQNKVVFKPYKALREHVNRPFRSLESQIIPDEPDHDETDSSGQAPILPFGGEASSSHAEPTVKKETGTRETDTLHDLIFERESPLVSEELPNLDRRATTQVVAEPEIKPVSPEKSIEDEYSLAFEENLARQEELARDVQENSNYRWSYTAAAIIVLLAIFLLLFWMDGDEPATDSDTATLGNGSTSAVTQVEEPESPMVAEEQRTDSGAGENMSQTVTDTDSESGVPSSAEQSSAENENLEMYSVQSGDTLWKIAETRYNDPYLWPLIYDANKGSLNNPNAVLAGSSITVPLLESGDQLTRAEREKVALGYLSVYEWIKNNRPENARYFLWAAGSFSQDVILNASQDIRESDLAFATQQG